MLIFACINQISSNLGYIFLGLAIGFLLIIPITITISYHIYRKFHPYLGPSAEEIEEIYKLLDTNEVKKYIKYMYSNRNAYFSMICKRIEKLYGVNLHHKKGSQWGQYYSEVIDKICEILGFADEVEYMWELYDKRMQNRKMDLK